MRLTVRSFIVGEHMEFWPQGMNELAMLVACGKLKYRETIAQDLASAPEAFLGLLKGKKFGKQLVKLTNNGLAVASRSCSPVRVSEPSAPIACARSCHRTGDRTDRRDPRTTDRSQRCGQA